jgi:hypothetical protein
MILDGSGFTNVTTQLGVIVTSNDGCDLLSTNYWGLDCAQSGLLYLSFNAGAGRLLVPKVHEDIIREVESADYVIVSSGVLATGQRAIEILFEDHSDEPFSITIQEEACDRTLSGSGVTKPFLMSLYTEAGKVLTFTARHRKVPLLPCNKPWF